MKNILFLTDFSESALQAIHYGCSLFANEKVQYFLLNVSKVGNLSLSSLISYDSIYDTIIRDDKEKLKNLKDALEQKYDIELKASIRFNDFIDAVKQYVAKYHINIVIAGFDGANSLKEKIFGSNTLKLIRSITTDTIIVPNHVTFVKPKTILCLLDDQDDLNIVLHNPFLIDKSIRIVRVINHDHYYDASKDQFLVQNLSNIDYKVISNIPLEYVKSYEIQTNPVDMSVLLVEEKSSVLYRLFQGDSTTKISKSLLRPILVLHQ